LAWLTLVCFTAGITKLTATSPRLGFLAHRDLLAAKLAAGGLDAQAAAEAAALMRNDLINAGMTGLFLAMTAVILALSLRAWWRLACGLDPAVPHEAPAVYRSEPDARLA
jgi:carbon starvation protein